MRKSTTGLLVILLLAIAVGSTILLMGGGTPPDSSDDTEGTDPTDDTDDIINPPPPPPPTEPTNGILRFYVLLDSSPVTGATCIAGGKSTATSQGYATLEMNIGTYDAKVTYGSRTSTKRVYVGASGAHVEVLWASDITPPDPDNPPAEPDPGRIKVYAYLDGIPIPADVEVWHYGTKVDSGAAPGSFDVEEGTYTVKAVFMSSQTYSGQKSISVKSGEVTSVTFSWDSGGMGDLSIFSEGSGLSRGLLLLVAIGILLLSKGKHGLKI